MAQVEASAGGAAMDALSVSVIQLSPVKDFDQKVETRAQKREHLRGRNNVTSCRSPTRDFDTKLIKNELKEKRQLEFLRRRSVSPEASTKRSSKRTHTFSMKFYNPSSKSETMKTFPAANGHAVMSLRANSSEDTNKWASLWSEQLIRQDKKQASTSTQVIQESKQHRMKSVHKTSITIENIHQKSSENILQKKILRENSVQTAPGLVTVKESDIQRLADYLQESLWREEVVKQKLAALQESTSNLMNSSNKIWTSRCTEDLLRNKIKSLEAQLQVCLQKLPKDGVKKLVLQMEKQRMVYEEKALTALQKATQEKTEALNKAETLQEALITAKADALHWQSLYEELKLSSGQLRENQHLSNEQLTQLHSQVELSRAREDELREEVASLRQEKQELQYNIGLLEEDKQILRDEIQQLRDGSDQESETGPTVRRDFQLEEQLRHTQEKLQHRDRECDELKAELHAMEQECQSSQARLSQCREELRQLSHRRRRPTLCGSWWKVCLFFLFLLTVAAVAMLWMWHPPFREQIEDLYADIETRIEDYLREMSSPQYSGCFRPI